MEDVEMGRSGLGTKSVRASVRENLGRLQKFRLPIFQPPPFSTQRDSAKKKNDSECIGIAEGGARTRDLEVVIYREIRATRSTD